MVDLKALLLNFNIPLLASFTKKKKKARSRTPAIQAQEQYLTKTGLTLLIVSDSDVTHFVL